MKQKITKLLLLLGFSTLALAHPAQSATWKSAEAIRIEAARADALIQGKKLLVKSGAAWCGPCAALDEFLITEAAALKPALDRYIVVKLEELHFEMFYLTDSLAHDNYDFPNIYLIDPTTGREDNLSFDSGDAAAISETLQMFADGKDLATEFQGRFRAALAAGALFGTDTPKSAFPILEQAIYSTAYTKSDKEFATFAAEVRNAAAKFPDQFSYSPGWGIPEYFCRVYDAAASRPEFDPAVATSIDAAAFTDFTAGANVFYGYVYTFQTQLSRIYRSQGLVATATACDAIKTKADAFYSAADYYDGGGAVAGREIQCAELAYLAGLASKADTLARYMAIPATNRDAALKRSTAFYASIGEFALAIETLEKSRTKELKIYGSKPAMAQRLNEAFDELKKAFQAGKTHP